MKRLAFCLLIGLITLTSQAQPGRFRPEMFNDEELIQMQIRDIVSWLKLEGKESELFIQDYTAFKKEIKEVAKNATPPQFGDSEDEIDKALQNNLEVSEKILQIRKKYYNKFKAYLKPSQIQTMYWIENEAGRRMPPPPPSHPIPHP